MTRAEPRDDRDYPSHHSHSHPLYRPPPQPQPPRLPRQMQQHQQQQQHPQPQWPQPVREYVERCFKAARPSQRPNLQLALRLIIQDAQTRGEIYSRPWGALPPPDLNLRPDQAAAMVISATSRAVPSRGSRFDLGPPGVIGPPIPKPSMVSASTTNKKRCMDDGPVRQGDGALAVGVKSTAPDRVRARQRRIRLHQEKIDPLSIDWDRFAILGTCKTLEKAYFRLTSAPDPSTVRPAPVLRKALARLVGLIASGDVNYFYSQDQFKGMRQDCVVQALKGDLPVAIYEAHARAALEYGDTAEYNQCQGQLRGLYTPSTRKPEFVAYRILYQSVFWFLNRNKGEIVVGLLESLGDAEGLADAANVSHALEVRQALVSSNYAAFFRLYDSAPALGRALMDLAVPKLRFACLEGFMRAFKMRLEVGDFLCNALGFLSVSDTSSVKSPFYEPGCSRYSTGEFEGKYRPAPPDDRREAIQECMAYLDECGVVLFPSSDAGSDEREPPVVDCKKSLGCLRMPEEKDAVAHGDAALDLNDFLKTL